MAKVNAPLYSLNGGEVGDEALARLDLERLQFAGALYENILPRVIGSMTLRPGLEHIADIDFGDVMLLEYNYSGSSSLVPVLSDSAMRIVRDNGFVSRAAVSTAITSGDFSSFSGWTDTSTGNATAGVSGGFLVLTGGSQDIASATQIIAVAPGDQNVEHGLRIEVKRGPVTVRLGTSANETDLLPKGEAVLDDGVHSIAFTPPATSAHLELRASGDVTVLVEDCQIDSAGTLVIAAPWTASDLSSNIIRYRQNLDVLYVASRVYQQREIQRRSDTSWGIQRYKVRDGPFATGDDSIALTPSSYTGQITLSANRPYFASSMTGRLFRLYQSGQAVIETLSSGPATTDPVRIAGVGSTRTIQYSISGTWTGKVRLQVAVDDGSGNPSSWSELNYFTGNLTATPYTDPDDNVIKYFRFALQGGDLTSGSVEVQISHDGGSQSGIARVLGVTDSTTADAEVVSRFYSVNSTFEWDYSTWSDYDGWPSAVETFSGRLYWGQGSIIYGSVPDAYRSFDDTVAGESAPIIRSIGSGAHRGVLWLLGLQRLMAGTDASEVSIKASSFDSQLTASEWSPVEVSTRGCADIRPVKADKDGIFVQASGTALFKLALDSAGVDYTPTDLTAMHEHICDRSPIVDMAVQRRPDTVIWLVLANGQVRTLTYEPAERVVAWARIVTNGTFNRVAISRGAGQDNVFFAVTRNSTQRLERLADLTDCQGGGLNCLADGFTRFTATASQTVFPVPQLDGLDVVVWANGEAVYDADNLYTVSGGQVVLPPQSEGVSVVIGMTYSGRWRSTKLAYGAQGGTALMQRKRVTRLGLYLLNTILDGLTAGKHFGAMRSLTKKHGGKAIADGTLQSAFDADLFAISSDWTTDSRICLEAKAPYPFTAAALVMDISTNA